MAEKILFKKTGERHFTQIETLKKGAWICFVNPTETELSQICINHDLDYSIVTDALDPYEAPRFEIEDGVKYIFVRFPVKRAGNTDTETALVVINENYFMTFSRLEVPVMAHFDAMKTGSSQKTKMFIEYLAAINQEFAKQIQGISKQIRATSSNIENIDNKEIARFVEFERILSDFLAALVPMNMVFERILYGKLLRLYEQDEDLVQDLSLSTEQLIESCKSNMRYLVNIRESYSTILSNNLNRTMKILTSVTILLTIPTMIYSFFGMNVALPYAQEPWAVLLILSLTVFIMIFMIVAFSKSKLLK